MQWKSFGTSSNLSYEAECYDQNRLPHSLTPMLDQSLQFLTPEESAEVDKALLTSPEKFLTRLTLSTAKLLKYIAADLKTPVDQLTNAQIISWFEKDAKIKREQGVDASVLKWQAPEVDQLSEPD